MSDETRTDEEQAAISSLRTQLEALARKAAHLEAERDAARRSCEILRTACTFMTGYLSAIEGLGATKGERESAAATRFLLEDEMQRASGRS